MPKTLITILLIFSLSYQLFVKLAVVVWYEYNKDYIAKNLCENRDKPEKNCCGKCVLRKQLNKTADGSAPAGKTIPSKWNMGEVDIFIMPQQITLAGIATPGREKMLIALEQFHSYTPIDNVFRPPLVC